MNIILGHLVGDYLLQSDWMAINKKQKGLKGHIACIIHCVLWSLSIFMFAFMDKPYKVFTFCMLFVSHYFIDRTNIVKTVIDKTRLMPNPATWKIIIVDNTIHLLTVWILYIYLG